MKEINDFPAARIQTWISASVSLNAVAVCITIANLEQADLFSQHEKID
ncbi:MAG TPA: hypothetical protein VIM41_13535 [Gammaproteobacteria bacterium]